MYRILLVDDEDFALEGLLHGIPFRELGFEQVFTARNVIQAKEILLTERIDILLCDIEMPGESGLKLLEWIKEFQIQVVSLILTCHADFEYSRSALKLGSLDYILKPVAYEEVKEALAHAICKAEQLLRQKDATLREKLLLKNRERLVEELWGEILKNDIPVSERLLAELYTYIDADYSKEYRYRIVLTDILFSHEDVDAQEDKNVRFAIKNIAEEVLLKKQGWVFWERESLVWILCESEDGEITEQELKENIRQFFRICRQYLECYFNAFYSPAVHMEEIAGMYGELCEKARQQVFKKEMTAYVYEKLPIPNPQFALPDLEKWKNLMRTGREEEIRTAICSFTRRNMSEDNLNGGILEYYTGICMQAAYACAGDFKCGTDFLMGSSMQIQMNKAFRSEEQYELFVSRLVKELCIRRQSFLQGNKKSISDKAKEYVGMHLAERLLNEQIAQALFLNSDYLNRIFKKETGITLTEYIISQRIEKAKELLLTSGLSVSEIAMEVGFRSFSYFTKVFKKRTGKEPLKYRKDREK